MSTTMSDALARQLSHKQAMDSGKEIEGRIILPPPFDDLYFVPRIARQLKQYIENPLELPPVLLLHGYPGLGKTEFAKRFAKHFASQMDYRAMNENSRDATKPSFIKKLYFARTTVSLFGLDDKVLEGVTILDEFHNIKKHQQDAYKVRIDDMMRIRPLDRLIICINTMPRRDNVLAFVSGPIVSRSHCIDFNVQTSEVAEHAKFLVERFPRLKLREIVQWLPDMRRIQREHNLRKVSWVGLK